MLITRYAKIIMSLVLAAFCLLVTFDNITDYGTNYLFVQHVMSMDTTYPGNALMYRSITNPVLWRAAYAAIIVAEGITGILYLAGAIRLFQARNAPAACFNRAKTYVIAVSALAFLVWFFGFMGWLPVNGSPCGSRRRGLDRKPHSASMSPCSPC